MSIIKDYTEKTNTGIYPIKLTEGVANPANQLCVISDFASLTLPKSDELTASTIPEVINASHLFVADGQECICLTDTIPPKTNEIM